MRIGSACQHATGKGFNIQIETVPLDGRSASASRLKKTGFNGGLITSLTTKNRHSGGIAGGEIMLSGIQFPWMHKAKN